MTFLCPFNRACLIQPLDSATNTTVGKSKELSIDLEEPIIDLNKSRKSIGSISKQLHGTSVSQPRSPAAERKLVRMVKSQQNTTKKQICNELEAAGRQVLVSTVKCVFYINVS